MNTGLILVGVQKGYFHGGRMELVGMDEASTKAGQLLSYFRENGLPTVQIQQIATVTVNEFLFQQ